MKHAKLWSFGRHARQLCCARYWGADPAAAAPAAGKVKVLILVGGHPFDQPGFDRLWKSFHDIISCDTWKGSPYTAFDDVSHFKYDVIVMYNLSSGITPRQRQNFLKLLDRGVGLVVWHHALANCQDWPEFEKIAGARFWLGAGRARGGKGARQRRGLGQVQGAHRGPQPPHHPRHDRLHDGRRDL